MFCYECCNNGRTREAVGLCHHFSAALCVNHAHKVDDPVTAIRLLNRIAVLPKHSPNTLRSMHVSASQSTKHSSDTGRVTEQ